jgi:hypothetical protein
MNENKLKHLEFIQNVITRMASNSFLLKGWSVTLVSAIFALAAKDANRGFAIVAYLPIIMFWILDGYFLSQERQYRAHFNDVAASNTDDFGMDASRFNEGKNTWCSCFFSKTLSIFHITLILVALIVMFKIQNPH